MKNRNEYEAHDAERIKEVVVEMLESDAALMPNDELLHKVEEIDFTKPKAFDILTGWIELYARRAVMTIHPDCVIREEYQTHVETHTPEIDNMEEFMIEPWVSSEARVLWKTLTSEYFTDKVNGTDGLNEAAGILELVSLTSKRALHTEVCRNDDRIYLEPISDTP